MAKKTNAKSVPTVAPSKTVLVRVFVVDWEKLKKIKTKYGFPNYAETVGYILQKFPEMIEEQPKPEKGIIPFKPVKLSEIIDADKANKDFVQLGEVKKP